MANKLSTSEKEAQLFELHHHNLPLVLPNIWDPLGALLLQNLGYKAIATASASIAASNGYHDGEKIPFSTLLSILSNIVNSVSIPVTADIENGYAANDAVLKENINQLIDIGISGINYEDSVPGQEGLIPLSIQTERIHLIRKVADERGSKLFINARTDVYIHQKHLSEKEKLSLAIERGIAFKNAGADCFYPIIVHDQESIQSIMDEVQLPINLLMISGIPDFATLVKMKVARVSLGPGFLKLAMNAMKTAAQKLLHQDGMDDIKGNPFTSDDLFELINKK